MEVISTCPLRATSVVWQPRPGAWALTAIVKATYRLEPIRSPLADVQEAPLEEDSHWDDDPRRSLSAASDLAPIKRRPEVLLVGHAFAPGGKPVRSLLVRLQVGDIDKVIEVWCDRAFSQDGSLLEGRPFSRTRLRWERAAGGPGTWNPVGMRFDASPDMYGSVPVPNLQPPGRLLAWRGDTFEPVGFGPLSPAWPSRAGQLSPEAAARWAARWFAQPLPEGMDAGFFNAAPLDQQTAELRADERIVLENLHPEHPRLVTNLSGVKPRAVVERATGEREEVRLVADTLWIDTDRGIASLVWRGGIGLRERAEAGRIVVWVEGEDAELPPPAEGARLQREPDEAVETVVIPGGAGRRPVLPFQLSSAAPAALETPPAAAQASAERPRGRSGGADTLTSPFLEVPPPALPFQEGAPPPALPFQEGAAEPWSAEDDETTATAEPLRMAAPALPFAPQAPQIPWASPPAPEIARSRETPAPPPMVVPPAMVEAPPAAPPMVVLRAMVEAPPPVAPAPPPAAPAPPPATPAPPVVPAPEPPEPTVAPRPEEPPPPEQRPIEQCAAIAASLARRKEDRAAILKEHALTDAQWAALSAHWAEEIKKETRRGKAALMEAYDDAYVARLEEERGPITVEEYARLVVAAERASVDEVLDRMTLPRGAMMRITRVWLRRMSGDAKLAERVGEAVDAVREEE